MLERQESKHFLAAQLLVVVALCLGAAGIGRFFILNNGGKQNQAAPSGNNPRKLVGCTALRQYSYTQLHMAMAVELTVWTQSEQQAQSACRAAFRRITELEFIFSDYDPQSELSRLCRKSGQGPQHVSKELLEVLAHAQQLSRRSGGAFDPTAGPVIRLWRQARRAARLPGEEDLASAMELVGCDKFLIHPEQGTVELAQPGMLLDLGGIAKGYIGDQVILELSRHGIRAARYRAGGDIVLGAAPPDSNGWKVDLPGIPDQELSHCGVAVSGDTQQFLEIEGRRYSHVIDPRTGRGVTTGRMVVVIAASGMESDSLASTGCVLEPDQFRWLISATPSAQAWGIDGSSIAPLEVDAPPIPVY